MMISNAISENRFSILNILKKHLLWIAGSVYLKLQTANVQRTSFEAGKAKLRPP